MSLIRLLIPGFSGLLEIGVLAVVFYYVMLFFRGTRSAQVMSGFILFLLSLIALTHFFHLDNLNWILQRISVYVAIAIIVIFQPEIRRAFAELGKQNVFAVNAGDRDLVDHIANAVILLANRKIGALIAIERMISTKTVQDTGIPIDAVTSAELLASIFFPQTPLHDGGVIIRNNRMVAAGCLFPLSQRQELSKSLGTRHRAAIGLSEETDAIVVVVSEETGNVSLACNGKIIRGLDVERLRRFLSTFVLRNKRAQTKLSRVKEILDLSPEQIEQEDDNSLDIG